MNFVMRLAQRKSKSLRTERKIKPSVCDLHAHDQRGLAKKKSLKADNLGAVSYVNFSLEFLSWLASRNKNAKADFFVAAALLLVCVSRRLMLAQNSSLSPPRLGSHLIYLQVKFNSFRPETRSWLMFYSFRLVFLASCLSPSRLPKEVRRLIKRKRAKDNFLLALPSTREIKNK